jgi:hypothetical protein
VWTLGIRNVIPVYGINGLTEEIVNWLDQCRVKRVVLMLDSDEAGRAAVAAMSARIEARGLAVRSVELPAKDAAEFVEQGGIAQQRVGGGMSCVQLSPVREKVSVSFPCLSSNSCCVVVLSKEGAGPG